MTLASIAAKSSGAQELALAKSEDNVQFEALVLSGGRYCFAPAKKRARAARAWPRHVAVSLKARPFAMSLSGSHIERLSTEIDHSDHRFQFSVKIGVGISEAANQPVG
jgi:hypothetical protein